jgi:hypothetical protein
MTEFRDVEKSQKAKLIEELNKILQVKDINWSLLPETDLLRLFDAFQRLKDEFEQLFGLIDEILDQPLTILEDKGKREYCV